MIFQQELDGLRQQKWRVHATAKERPMRTLDDAREFLNSVGFCLMYPVRPSLVAPTFIGAYLSTKDGLPLPALALLDGRAKDAELLSSRLLSEKAAFEVGFANDGVLLVSAAEFPYFYALIGERNPKLPPNPGARGEKALLSHTFEVIQKYGPVTELEIRDRLGKSISDTAVVRAVHELWSKLRLVRVNHHADGSSPWDVLYRWAPEQVNAGKQVSAREALSALISRYLETVIAAEQKDVEDFFSPMVPRSRVAEVIRAMQGAREFSQTQVAGKSLLSITPRGEEQTELGVIGSAREKETAEREKKEKLDQKFAEKRTRAAERSGSPGNRTTGGFDKFREKAAGRFDKQRKNPAGAFEKRKSPPRSFVKRESLTGSFVKREKSPGSFKKGGGTGGGFFKREKPIGSFDKSRENPAGSVEKDKGAGGSFEKARKSPARFDKRERPDGSFQKREKPAWSFDKTRKHPAGSFKTWKKPGESVQKREEPTGRFDNKREKPAGSFDKKRNPAGSFDKKRRSPFKKSFSTPRRSPR